jgi:hypothetical protein
MTKKNELKAKLQKTHPKCFARSHGDNPYEVLDKPGGKVIGKGRTMEDAYKNALKND